MNDRRHATVPADFACIRRDGSIASIPAGSCVENESSSDTTHCSRLATALADISRHVFLVSARHSTDFGAAFQLA